MKLCLLFRFIDQYYVFVVHSTITSKVGNRSPKCKKENTENEMKHENLSSEISSPDENKTETSFSTSTLPSSSSREDESTTVRTGSTFYIPCCASVFYVMAASGFVCMFAMRVSLSVALVAMINQTAVTDDVVTINITNISNTDQCPRENSTATCRRRIHLGPASARSLARSVLIWHINYSGMEQKSNLETPRMQCNTGMATVWFSVTHQERWRLM